MTTKQIEARLASLEERVTQLQASQAKTKQGWQALIGIGTNDPVMKEVMKLALQSRERDRRATRPKTKRKKSAS